MFKFLKLLFVMYVAYAAVLGITAAIHCWQGNTLATLSLDNVFLSLKIITLVVLGLSVLERLEG